MQLVVAESAGIELDALGDGPVATAKRSGKTVVVEADDLVKRAEIAKEFGIAQLTFVPCKDEVLEYAVASIE